MTTTNQHRDAINNRPALPQTYICEAIGDAVSEALATGQFQEYLAERGWVLVHLGAGVCPEPPDEWLHEGIDITEPGWIDTLGRLKELWQAAWTAGYRVGQAARDTDPEGAHSA